MATVYAWYSRKMHKILTETEGLRELEGKHNFVQVFPDGKVSTLTSDNSETPDVGWDDLVFVGTYENCGNSVSASTVPLKGE